MAQRVKYELTEKAYRYLLIHGKERTTIHNFIDALVKDGILASWQKIDEYNYKITFKK